jgi:hypothetical protein
VPGHRLRGEAVVPQQLRGETLMSQPFAGEVLVSQTFVRIPALASQFSVEEVLELPLFAEKSLVSERHGLTARRRFGLSRRD